MKRTVAALVISGALISMPSVALAAGNPNGTGQPSQSCQTVEAATGHTPGHAATSPGSPFNEPGINSTTGGKGGSAYTAGNAHSPNPKAVSQYDVACYHVSSH
jgi:hypothetical protein